MEGPRLFKMKITIAFAQSKNVVTHFISVLLWLEKLFPCLLETFAWPKSAVLLVPWYYPKTPNRQLQKGIPVTLWLMYVKVIILQPSSRSLIKFKWHSHLVRGTNRSKVWLGFMSVSPMFIWLHEKKVHGGRHGVVWKLRRVTYVRHL